MITVVSRLTLLFGIPLINGLDNGLGRTPGLGWNSDYCANCTHGLAAGLAGFQNEGFIKHIADYMHSHVQANGKTLQQLGYTYINMDASWDLPQRSTMGDLVPDPKLWPSGIDNTIEYVHSLGLKFGLYGDRGTLDCARNPGAQGHEKQDAAFLARHKVDWYKEDNCYASNGPADGPGGLKQYGVMRDALNATGYPIWFALCGWSTVDASDPLGGNAIGNSARIGPDTGGGWSAVLTNVHNGLATTAFSGPKGSGGFWVDGSLQLTPGMGHDGNRMSEQRHRSQFNAWAIMGMNILIVGNLSALEPYVLETWTNTHMLGINQDIAGKPAVPIPSVAVAQLHDATGAYTQAHVAECGGEPALQRWLVDVPAKGYISNDAAKICLNVMGCASEVIYDGCTTGSTPTCGGGHAGFHPNEQFSFDGSVIKSDLAGNLCLTCAAGSGDISIKKCDGSTSQKWSHDNSTNQLITGGGLCLTASSPPAPPAPDAGGIIAIGRPLASGGAALMYLNDDNVAATNVTCGAKCFSELGLPTMGRFTVLDVWLDRIVATTTPATGFSMAIEGGGDSRVVIISEEKKEGGTEFAEARERHVES